MLSRLLAIAGAALVCLATAGSAHAQVPLDRWLRRPAAVGSETRVAVPLYDSAISLDPAIVDVEPGGPGELVFRARSPGTGVVLILRGGLTETLEVQVVGEVRMESFRGIGARPQEGVPMLEAYSYATAWGGSKNPTQLQAQLGGSLTWSSAGLGVDHATQVRVDDRGGGPFVAVARSRTDLDTAGLVLGDVELSVAPTTMPFLLRGVEASWFPSGRAAGHALRLTAGGTRPFVCCGLVDPDAEGLLTAGGTVGLGPTRTHVDAGVLLPGRGEAPLPVALAREEIATGGARLQVGGGWLGGGVTLGAAGSLRRDRTRLAAQGSWTGPGAWVPRLGPASGGGGRWYATAAQRVARPVELGLESGGNVDAPEGGPVALGGMVGAIAQLGSRDVLALRYGRLFSRVDGEPVASGTGHQLGAAYTLARRGRRTVATAFTVLDDALALRSVFGSFESLGKLGAHTRFGPYALGTWVGASGFTVAGARLSAQQARFRAWTSAGLQAPIGESAGPLRAVTDGQGEWAFSRWGAVSGNANLGVDVVGGDVLWGVGLGLRVRAPATALANVIGGGLHGVAFLDLDGSGDQGPDEPGIANLRVRVLDKEAVTDAAGRFRFPGLEAATYTVDLDQAGYVLAGPSIPPVQVGAFMPGRVEIGLLERSRIDVLVFADADRDGKFGAGDWLVSSDGLEVLDPAGNTDLRPAPEGRLVIDEPETGVWTVRAPIALLDSGYVPTGSGEVQLVVGAQGYQRGQIAVMAQRRLSGLVCVDLNRNGRRDGADRCEPGVDVRLSDGRVAQTREGGRYFFEDLAPGEYTVSTPGAERAGLRFGRVPQTLDGIELLVPPAVEAPIVAVETGVPSPVVRAVRLQLGEATLKVGERTSARVVVTRADLSQVEVPAEIAIADRRVARLENGSLVGVSEGTTAIRAVWEGVESPAVNVRVRDLPVVGLVARPLTATLPIGGATPLVATALFVDGDTSPVTDRVSWTSTDPEIARVEGDGVLVAVAPGRAGITGSWLGVSTGRIDVVVTLGDAIPTALRVGPGPVVVGMDGDARLFAEASLDRGAPVRIVDDVRWTSADPRVVDVLDGGRVRPRGIGRTEVVASFRGLQSAPLSVEVVPAVGLVIAPGYEVLPAGQSFPIRAAEVLADGSFRPVPRARWSSDAPDVARVEDGALRTGAPGTARVVATHRQTSSLPVEVEVLDERLVGLVSRDDRLEIPVGGTAAIDALARWDGGRETLATPWVRWEVEDPAVASIDDDGLVRGLAVGRTRAWAHGGPHSAGPIALLVVDGAPEPAAAVIVEPSEVRVAVGGTRPVIASVVSARGLPVPGASVRWSVDDPAVAWVEAGVVRGISKGETAIRASHAELVSPPVPVRVAPIVGVSASPALGRLPVGARVAMQAVGVADDGGIELLDGARWTSSDPDVVRVSASGELLAFGPGRAELRALWRDAQTLPLAVEVADVDLAGLEIRPSDASVRAGERLPLAVVAVFGDGGTGDGTPHVTWTTTRPDVAAVRDGTLIGLSAGRADVYASWLGVRSPDASVAVAPAEVLGVALDGAPAVALVGDRFPLRATAVTASGDPLDAGGQVLWRTSDPSVARIDADGVLVALAPGPITVEAELGGIRSPALALEIADARVVRLDLQPGALAAAAGEPLALRAVATLSDGRSVEVTPQLRWEIDGAGIRADRYNALTLEPGAVGRVRAHLDGASSAWVRVVETR